ncbi:hypothetical protein IJH46_00820 [Candidatus Saccharibacteria bacterium]|nr:hypothetical protein [Candidatus Saccharibacteria bacterium]
MAKKTQKKVEKKKPIEGKEPKEPKEKQKHSGAVIGILVVLILVLAGAGGYFYYQKTKTVETTETVEVSDEARNFSNLFKEYLADRIDAQNLYSFTFRNLSNTEILDKLTELKDGFSKVSRGMNNYDEESEYAEIAAILKNDATVYLKSIRELRAVMTATYEDEADRQVQFIKVVEGSDENLRSGLYLSRAAFGEETEGIGKEGILIFEGMGLAEVGGGVMNIFVGDLDANVTAVTTGDFQETVRKIDSEKLYGFVNSRLVRFGKGILDELEVGKLETAKVTLGTGDAEVYRKKVSILGKSTWDFRDENAITGLIKVEEKGMSEILAETAEGIRGKK